MKSNHAALVLVYTYVIVTIIQQQFKSCEAQSTPPKQYNAFKIVYIYIQWNLLKGYQWDEGRCH